MLPFKETKLSIFQYKKRYSECYLTVCDSKVLVSSNKLVVENHSGECLLIDDMLMAIILEILKYISLIITSFLARDTSSCKG